ncbi:MAG TPA: 4-hydroxy-3-methylbut-2-en-1-yl diphosphate synthase [Porphyromonadaceae bacterium]|nr:4-hydroxy-3-methylbut-2-en-1-yl diphosphate synthase [Porphyromonadaceae bacterium]
MKEFSYFNYKRRATSIVQVGNTPLGGENLIRVQSMANTSTMDTESSVEQALRMASKGAEYIRFTTQGLREAENLRHIKEELRKRGCNVPLVADVHFNSKVALEVAKYVEKVRINPGNFVDGAKRFEEISYTDEEYLLELKGLHSRFVELLKVCKEHHTALRIGVNHGSLSDRIMSRYGDTPEGIVESCMEFLRICKEEKFEDVVVSIKSSNVLVMVKSVRRLVDAMEREGLHYPLHLGVTEAGNGEDGRIKSALGIGTLLNDGIGDTIRVSLSEPPECEIPVAKSLVEYIAQRSAGNLVEGKMMKGFDYLNPQRVESAFSRSFVKEEGHFFLKEDVERIKKSYTLFELEWKDLTKEMLENLKSSSKEIILLRTHSLNGVGEQRAFFHYLLEERISLPVIIERDYNEEDIEQLRIKASADLGPLLLDGFGDAICIHNEGGISKEELRSCGMSILQAARRVFSKPEYIACPSCGRTLFDLQTTLEAIKKATASQKKLKIGVMGCIVNGLGEMADADYGYIGSGRGEVNLYKGKECILRHIPQEEAVDKLVELIKLNGDWEEA